MLTIQCLAVMSTLVAMAGDGASTAPVAEGVSTPDESGPLDRAVTVPTALVAAHLIRVELHEGVGVAISLAVANRLQISGVALLPVFAHARAYVGQLKLRLFTIGRFTLSATLAKVVLRLTGSNQSDIEGGGLLNTYCFRPDCTILVSAGLWYGRRSSVVDTSPSSGSDWMGSANVIAAVSRHGALLADGWFGQRSTIMGVAYRVHGRMLFADGGFVVSADSLALPWVNLGWGVGVDRILAGLR